MTKDIKSYAAPLVAIVVLLACDYSYILMWILVPSNPEDIQTKDYILVAILNFLLFMVFWSHMKMIFSDPGYVPLGYNYNTANFQLTANSLYEMAKKHKTT